MRTVTHGTFLAITVLSLAVCSVPVRASRTAPDGATTNADFSQYEKKSPWKPSQELVDKLGAKRSTINYDEAKVRSYTLPDVLTLAGGAKVTS